ncbi:hypothetical protein ACW17M_11795 [Vreelandella sp. 2A-K22]
MPTQNTRLWTYSLPVALVLLAPFNILASLGMDIDLPIVPAMPAILGTTPDYVGCAYKLKSVQTAEVVNSILVSVAIRPMPFLLRWFSRLLAEWPRCRRQAQ